ncbi:hypothetical protein [Cellulomonas telluris]|uniref:hypothetical protein n=1 Tax=Cellulomonas telluris TaxID=2306636 RepID=UPI0010A946FF|nr:hypothetical protein [Cellulomonas telluris]
MSWHSDDTHGPDGLPDGLWPDDDRLAAELREALAEAALREQVAATARVAYSAHRGMLALREELDADLLLLGLVHDSLGHAPLAGVRDRSGQPSRTLVFEGDGVGVEVEVGERAVEGQLIPARPGRVTLRRPDGDVASTDTDEVGYFRIEAHPEGPVRLLCTSAYGVCVTEWLAW